MRSRSHVTCGRRRGRCGLVAIRHVHVPIATWCTLVHHFNGLAQHVVLLLVVISAPNRLVLLSGLGTVVAPQKRIRMVWTVECVFRRRLPVITTTTNLVTQLVLLVVEPL